MIRVKCCRKEIKYFSQNRIFKELKYLNKCIHFVLELFFLHKRFSTKITFFSAFYCSGKNIKPLSNVTAVTAKPILIADGTELVRFKY